MYVCMYVCMYAITYLINYPVSIFNYVESINQLASIYY